MKSHVGDFEAPFFFLSMSQSVFFFGYSTTFLTLDSVEPNSVNKPLTERSTLVNLRTLLSYAHDVSKAAKVIDETVGHGLQTRVDSTLRQGLDLFFGHLASFCDYCLELVVCLCGKY
jgi:hypothetical protein